MSTQKSFPKENECTKFYDALTTSDPNFRRVPKRSVEERAKFGHVGKSFMDDSRIEWQFYWHSIRKELLGCIFFGPDVEGPPVHTHGGMIAGVVDQMTVSSAYLYQDPPAPILTANLNINYRKKVPTNQLAYLQAQATKEEGRKVFVEGKISLAHDGPPHVQCSGLFIKPQVVNSNDL